MACPGAQLSDFRSSLDERPERQRPGCRHAPTIWVVKELVSLQERQSRVSNMIKALEQAIEKIKTLSKERQEYAAEVLEHIARPAMRCTA